MSFSQDDFLPGRHDLWCEDRPGNACGEHVYMAFKWPVCYTVQPSKGTFFSILTYLAVS